MSYCSNRSSRDAKRERNAKEAHPPGEGEVREHNGGDAEEQEEQGHEELHKNVPPQHRGAQREGLPNFAEERVAPEAYSLEGGMLQKDDVSVLKRALRKV